MTPLERAKRHKVKSPRRRSFNDDEIALALAWLVGDVSLTQATAGFGLLTHGTPVYARLARCLRAAYDDGRLRVK